jgi:hypothetical protein
LTLHYFQENAVKGMLQNQLRIRNERTAISEKRVIKSGQNSRAFSIIRYAEIFLALSLAGLWLR